MERSGFFLPRGADDDRLHFFVSLSPEREYFPPPSTASGINAFTYPPPLRKLMLFE